MQPLQNSTPIPLPYKILGFIISIGLLLFVAHTISENKNKELMDKNIELCLRELFSSDLGYTLIGCKPVSFESCRSCKYDERTRNALFDFLRTELSRTGKYIIRIGRFHSYSRFPQILLVHKKALLKTIAKESVLQNFIRKKFATNDAFLSALARQDTDIFTLLSGDEVLLGIVLGYGRENSMFYRLRCSVGRQLKKYSTACVWQFNHKPSLKYVLPLPCSSPASLPFKIASPQYDTSKFSSPEQCWEWIKDKETGANLFHPPILIELPGFVSCKGRESQKISKNLCKARDKLASLFCQKTYKEAISEQARLGA